MDSVVKEKPFCKVCALRFASKFTFKITEICLIKFNAIDIVIEIQLPLIISQYKKNYET